MVKQFKFGWHASDIVIIIITLLLTYAVALWSGIKEKKDSKGQKHAKSGLDFFLGGRDMPWYLVGMSITASNIGTDVLIALTGSVASAGLGAMSYEVGSGFSILCLGWVIGPMYLRKLVRTVPEWAEKRYSSDVRYVFVMMMTVVFILSKMGVNVYGGALLFQTMTGFENPWPFIPVIIIITAVYTAVGGLEAVMWTDLVQILLFMITGIASIGFCLKFFNHRMGDLIQTLRDLGLDHLTHIVLPTHNPEYPWYASTIGMLTHEFYYWSTDQEMAQRVISAHGLGEARVGAALGSILKVTCFFLSVIPGWTARVFYERCLRGDPAYSNWCGPTALAGNYDMSSGSQANRAYPLLVMRNYPQAFKGLMISGFIAALMSNLSAVINSLSTILTYDLYAQILPKSQRDNQRKLLLAGRATVVLCAAVAIIWQLGIQKMNVNLFTLSMSIQQHFGSPIAATLFIGAAWKGSTVWGGRVGLYFGVVFGVLHTAFYLKFYNSCQQFWSPTKESAIYPTKFWRWSCMSFGWSNPMTWGIVIVANIAVSLCTPKPTEQQKQATVIYKDILPMWLIKYIPGVKKLWKNDEDMLHQYQTGYIEAILKESKMAQMQVDNETEEAKHQHGHHDPEKPSKNGAGKKGLGKFFTKSKGNNGKMQADSKADTHKGTNGGNQNGLQDTNINDPDVKLGMLDKVEIDDETLLKEQKHQERLMFMADFFAVAALFLALFVFVYFR